MEEVPGQGEWRRAQQSFNPEFHKDVKLDPTESLVDDLGIEGAIDRLESQLNENPGDPEIQRRINLIANRLDDLRKRTQH